MNNKEIYKFYSKETKMGKLSSLYSVLGALGVVLMVIPFSLSNFHSYWYVGIIALLAFIVLMLVFMKALDKDRWIRFNQAIDFARYNERLKCH